MGKTDPHPLDQDFREDIVDAGRVTGFSLREAREGFLKLVKPVASLRLTVILFSLSLVLVFCGTVAQKDASNWRVVNEYFRSFLVWIPLQTFVKFIQVFSIQTGSTTIGLSPSAEVPYSFPFPGGWAIGSLLMANLIAAHLVRFKMNWKRSGIVILHAGVGTLMVGELITGLYAIEGNMIIPTGQSSSFVAETNGYELAVVDPSNAKEDEVTVVPAHMLRKKGNLIQHEDLPFDIEAVHYMPNSQMSKEPPSEKYNVATAGAGLTRLAIQVPEGSGVEKDQKVDTPSIYVTLKKKDSAQAIGTFLFSVWLADQAVTVDGKKYEVSLRQKRHHKPYSLHLKKFDHDLYPGTEKAKNYSSLVQLVDPTRGENREFLISMNHPLRYGGETFYQSGVLENDAGTILQVVRNPGWILPYVACSMVSLGMLLHFGIHLVGFLRLRAAR